LKKVFGFKGRYISNGAKVRRPIKHFIGGEAKVLLRGCPNSEYRYGKTFSSR
jgi:hypothetical protein